MRKTFMIPGLLGIALLVCGDRAPAGQSRAAQPAAKESQTPLVNLDGHWTTIYAQIDGKKVPSERFANVTVKNNVVTCRVDGKVTSYQLDFGPDSMIRCAERLGEPGNETTEQRIAHTHYGVYVASPDYFCLSLHRGMDPRFERSGAAQKAAERWQGRGPTGADMVIIFRRVETTELSGR